MKRCLSKMNTNELRNLAASIGCDKKKLYGTSKQSIIITINNRERELENDPEFQKRMSEVQSYIDQNYKPES